MPLTTTLIILYSVEIIVYSFHLSMLILMISKQRVSFQGPFYNIFRILLVADLGFYIGLIVTQKLPLLPSLIDFYKNNILFHTVSFDVLAYSASTQFFGHLFLALNRFTLIWFPLKHEYIWKRQWYTVVILGIPFLSVSWRLHEPQKYTFTNDGNIYVSFINSYATPINYTVSTVLYLATTCLAGILNVLACLKIFLHKQNSSALNVNEKNLLFVSLVCFIAQLLRAAYNVARIFESSNPDIVLFLTSILPILNDIFAWSGSLSLMFLSSTTRKAYKSFYFCKSQNQVISQNSTAVKKFLTLIKI